VNVPVRMYTATTDKDVRFTRVHAADMAQAKQRYHCTSCQSPLDDDEVARAYEYAKKPSQFVTVSDQELEQLKQAKSRAMQIVQFLPAEAADALSDVWLEKAYYVVPDEAGGKAYALLREAMSRNSVVAVAKLTQTSRTHLGLLRFDEKGLLLLNTMHWPDEVKEAPYEQLQQVELTDQEVEMAKLLVEALTEDELDWPQYRDEYREGLLAMLNDKVAGVEPALEPVPEERPTVDDLMETLRRSLEARANEPEIVQEEAAV
jgi:DNA end-binding protein Ku